MVMNCHTYPSADCGSDHILLVAKCRLLLTKSQEKRKEDVKRINLSPLKNKRKAIELATRLDESMEQIPEEMM